jgi:MFS family permease
MCLGFVRSFASFFAVRALLGLAEGGLLPGIVLYLSGMYTRREMAVRIGLFFTAATLSGAFGGMFDYFVEHRASPCFFCLVFPPFLLCFGNGFRSENILESRASAE